MCVTPSGKTCGPIGFGRQQKQLSGTLGQGRMRSALSLRRRGRRECEAVKHTFLQQFVLGAMTPGRVWRSENGVAVDDDLMREELIAGEVHFSAIWQSIPIVVANLTVINVHFADDQLAA